MFQSINPATNKILNEYDEYSKEKINLIIKDVSSEFNIWKTVNIKKRSKVLLTIADKLNNNIKNILE